jgi:lysophospholipase L1-like esterase
MRFHKTAGPLAVVFFVAGLVAWMLIAAPAGAGNDAEAQPFAAPTASARLPLVNGVGAGHVVLALGDSVPSGYHCDCDPFPEAYGAMLSRQTGTHVVVDNRAVGGLDTSGLLAQLRTPDFQNAVRRSDVILLEIGANDFGDHHKDVVDGTCETANADCVSDELGSLRDNLNAAIGRIKALRQGQPTTVLTSGYWNVFQDGDVARNAVGESGLQASLALTRRANAVISSVSDEDGVRYVDLYRPFEHSGRNVTSLMSDDGDHPDAAGHQLIARTLLDAGLPRVS